MKYKLITGFHSELTDNINLFLSKGWKLYGNPFIIEPWRGSMQYAQAVTKSFADPFIVITGSTGMIYAELQTYKNYGYEKLSKPLKTGEMIEIAGEKHPEYILILKKVNHDNTTCSV